MSFKKIIEKLTNFSDLKKNLFWGGGCFLGQPNPFLPRGKNERLATSAHSRFHNHVIPLSKACDKPNLLVDQQIASINHDRVINNYEEIINEDEEFVLSELKKIPGVPSIINKDNIVGFQFHPEKSQRNGIKLLENYFEKYDG